MTFDGMDAREKQECNRGRCNVMSRRLRKAEEEKSSQ